MTALRVRVADRVGDVWPGGRLREFEPLPGGHSGVTCVASVAVPGGEDVRVVVKAAPPGRAPVGRHDVLRQARILTAMTAAGSVGVPEVLLQQGGAEPFFLMRWHPGESIEPVLDAAPHLTPDAVQRRAFSAVEALAALHRVPVGALDEPVLTPRQELERWTATMGTLDPELRAGSDEIAAALLDTAPPELPPVVVHGDFRLGNTLCVGGDVGVVIDWEIWSVGDPRVDLGWLLLFCDGGNFPGVAVAGCPMPPARTLRAAYERAAGARVKQFEWFEAMARYKMGAIMGNNLARHRAGRHHDPFQEGLVPTIRAMIEGAGVALSRS